MKSPKKTTKKPPERSPKSVPGTPREHRMIDAGKLRDDVKSRAPRARGAPAS